MAMMRQEGINLRSFPATIALERLEAQIALGDLGKVSSNTSKLAMNEIPTIEDFDAFPSIEWSNDHKNQHTAQPSSNHLGSLGREFESFRLRQGQKRMKITKDRSRGLCRSRRIDSSLHQLDIPNPSKGMSFESSFGTMHTMAPRSSTTLPMMTNDLDLEKILQSSFCDNEETKQVTLVA